MLFDVNQSRCELHGTMRAAKCAAAAVLAFSLLLFAVPSTACAQRAGKKNKAGANSTVQTYPSPHFLLHTDLPPGEARELLKQLEVEVKLIAVYWGRPPSGILECYVAKDLATWPEQLLNSMEPKGIAKIREGAGVCLGTTMSAGDRFMAKARVYAVSKEGVPLHEAVHGYCLQTFGRSGPHWYAEGMAELGHYWLNGKKGVNANPYVIKYLRESPPRQLADLIVTDEELGGTWQDYAWWWFLCHLLENNPNYSAEFRALGPELLAGKDTGFRQVFGARIKELTFEYGFFLQHLETGYRVDLCSWDWKRKFFTLIAGRAVSATIQANRGWQPSGLTVSANTRYEYSATGTWRTGKDAETVDVGGASEGRGRLVGILMKDYQLGEEFELGQSGSFTAPADGNLYLRCRAVWNKLADNSGRITVKFRLKGQDATSPAEK
jgi:hypothetical protein